MHREAGGCSEAPRGTGATEGMAGAIMEIGTMEEYIENAKYIIKHTNITDESLIRRIAVLYREHDLKQDELQDKFLKSVEQLIEEWRER